MGMNGTTHQHRRNSSIAVAILLTLGAVAVNAFGAGSKDDLIASPRAGERVTGKTSIWLNLPDHNGLEIRVKLNGRDISNAFNIRRRNSPANGRMRTVQSAVLSEEDGLRPGRNLVVAHLKNPGHKPDYEHHYFDWSPKQLRMAAAAGAPDYPPAVGVVVPVPATGGAVIQIGGQAIQASSCTTSMQVLVLDRSSLAQLDYQCFNDATGLKNYLSAQDNTRLVLASTTESHVAPPGLDTTPIGGTNYSSTAPTLYPYGYMILGAGKAKPGQATENYYVETTPQAPFQYAPMLQGIFLHDNHNYYAFHPSDMAPFTVSPRDPSRGKSMVVIYNITYTNPPQTWGAGGFWLLTLDRMNLHPTDSNWNGGTPCDYFANINDGTCGQFFPTGATETSVAYPAMSDLASAITSATQNPRNLLILVSVDTPLQYPASATLANAITKLGGSEYALQQVYQGSQSYTLISSTDPAYAQALTGQAIESTSVHSQQKQTGYVRGLFKRGQNSLFGPVTFAHESAQQVASGKGRVFELEPLLWQQPVAWPLTDTPGHIAAYQALSNMVINRVLTNPSGDHLNDIRYYYYGSQGAKFGQYQLNPGDYPYPSNAQGFTTSDWNDAVQQIRTELGYLGQVQTFLGPEWVGGIMTGSGTPMVLGMFQAAANLSETELRTVNDQVKVNVPSIYNLAIAGLELVGDFFDPASVLGDALTLASQTGVFDDDTSSLPGTEYAILTNVASLAANAQTYALNVENAYNMMTQAIYCDWGKLSYIGKATVDTSSPWYQTSKTVPQGLVDAFNLAAKKYTYIQALPKMYKKDAWLNQQASSLQAIGSWKLDTCDNKTGSCEYRCTSFYATRAVPADATRIYTALSDSTTGDNSVHDVYVLSTPIANNSSTFVSQSYPSDQLMTLLTGSGSNDFNIPVDVLFAPNSPVQNQSGPIYSNVEPVCYSIGSMKKVP